ncbi:MAG: helix-turn-helix transcriptional regulator [Gemmatimonadetes bacterium]|nr:helix-turn-helix transcriptional regulator [Gemmatimonadota bacterium]
MGTAGFLGAFEQMVLLATLQLGEEGYATAVRRELARARGKDVSRGALYRTFDRLGEKGYLEWTPEEAVPDRGGHPRRRFKVTEAGIAALRASRSALVTLSHGLHEVLGEP